MLDRKIHVEELIEGAQLFRRKGSVFLKRNDTDITGSEWFVIGHIAQHLGATTKETATALHMTGSAVTQLVNGLVSKGYITRDEDPRDRRVQRLVLTVESKKRINAFKAKRVRMMLKMFEALTDKEFTEYCALNRKISRSMMQK